MMTLLVVVLMGTVLTALYAVGAFNAPYTDAFRIEFILLILMNIVAVVLAMGRHPFEGYDSTPSTP